VYVYESGYVLVPGMWWIHINRFGMYLGIYLFRVYTRVCGEGRFHYVLSNLRLAKKYGMVKRYGHAL
jgi:hypothetical protein